MIEADERTLSGNDEFAKKLFIKNKKSVEVISNHLDTFFTKILKNTEGPLTKILHPKKYFPLRDIFF
jgi:hypothetical protein